MAKEKIKRRIVILERAASSIEQISLYYLTEFSVERTEKVLNSINATIEYAAAHQFLILHILTMVKLNSLLGKQLFTKPLN